MWNRGAEAKPGTLQKLHRPSVSAFSKKPRSAEVAAGSPAVFEAETAGGPEGALAAGGQRHQRQREAAAWQQGTRHR